MTISIQFPEVPKHSIKIVPKSQLIANQVQDLKNELLRTKDTEKKISIVSKMTRLSKEFEKELEKEKMNSLLERRNRLGGGAKRKTRKRTRKTKKIRKTKSKTRKTL